MTAFKLASTALATATIFAMSTATVFAMGGRSSRPGSSGGANGSSSATVSSSGSSSSSSMVGSDNGVGSSVTSVPEIDASTGLLALAAVLAIVAFVWERNRRQQA
ncbi:MAG: VPEID-CTERM sorting domain-containing protein [Rhodobacterales bacterium]|nr:VPEID-CTERM sorting domain-containing protein [Rhodobacterales bacterium]MDX5412094.1 VPEID-CTERM sorting domain-containing protein [Rhodobacterales bacterium]